LRSTSEICGRISKPENAKSKHFEYEFVGKTQEKKVPFLLVKNSEMRIFGLSTG
jgi:hypothetical protein